LSCTHPPLQPLSADQRIPIHFTLIDRTGTSVDTLILSSLQAALASDFLYSLESTNSSWDLPGANLRTAQNPLRFSTESHEGAAEVTAEIERADYGPVSSLRKTLAGYAFLGLLGAALFGPSEDDYAAAIQLRYVTKESPSQSGLTRMAMHADVRYTSRYALMKATSNALVRQMLFPLGTGIAKERRLPLAQSSQHVTTMAEARRKLALPD
jgi:hypothetical protein